MIEVDRETFFAIIRPMNVSLNSMTHVTEWRCKKTHEIVGLTGGYLSKTQFYEIKAKLVPHYNYYTEFNDLIGLWYVYRRSDNIKEAGPFATKFFAEEECQRLTKLLEASKDG
jgi:hypothetical protein